MSLCNGNVLFRHAFHEHCHFLKHTKKRFFTHLIRFNYIESTTQWQLKLTHANKYIDHICKLAVNTSHVRDQNLNSQKRDNYRQCFVK